jgi:predicted dehydrogenase
MDEIRIGVIGSGMMGAEHIRNFNAIPGAAVTAIADPNEESLDMAEAQSTTPVRRFSDYRDLMDADACDAVVVATPNFTHIDVLRDVIPSHLHTLIEKPLCTNVADCRTVVELADASDTVTWMGLEYRYMPPVARLIDEIHAGAIGSLKMLSIREHRFPFLVKVKDWNRFSANTGGTLVEKTCHFFDLMNHIIQADPSRVFATGGQDVNHLDEVYDGEPSDILDNAYVIVEYDNGVRAMLDLCMFAEGGRHQEEIVGVGDIGKIEAYLPSSEVSIGMRATSWFSPTTEKVSNPDGVVEGFHHGSSYTEDRKFVDAIRSGAAAEVTVRDGLISVAIGVAAHRSIEEGRPVHMSEVL